MKKRITLISDTHTRHEKLNGFLPGGDLLIHAGDIMNSGYSRYDIENYCEWFDGLDNSNSTILPFYFISFNFYF